MPDLSDRNKYEAAIVVLLLQAFAAFRAEGRLDEFQAAWARLQEEVAAAIAEVIPKVFEDAAAVLGAEHGADSDVSSQAAAYVATRSQESATRVVRTTIKSISTGTPPEEALSKEKAEQIAATEVTAAISAGEAAIAGLLLVIANVQIIPIWHTERDEKVCPVCAPLNGTGAEVYGRVSPSGPPAHPRCRCWLDYEVAT